jgi:hypothetical protein
MTAVTLESYQAHEPAGGAMASLHAARSSRCGCEHGVWGRQEARRHAKRAEHCTVGATPVYGQPYRGFESLPLRKDS